MTLARKAWKLAYNNWLQGEPGSKRVIKDLFGRTVSAKSNWFTICSRGAICA